MKKEKDNKKITDKSKNKGGAPLGSQNRLMFKTEKERLEIYQKYCKHLSSGFNKNSFPDIHYTRIEEYIKMFPDEFDIETIEIAKRAGEFQYELIGHEGMRGKIRGFNAKAFEFMMMNKFNYRRNIDVKSDNKNHNTGTTRIVNVNIPDNGRIYKEGDKK